MNAVVLKTTEGKPFRTFESCRFRVNSNSMWIYPQVTRRKVTTTHEYDDEGRIVKTVIVEEEIPSYQPVYNPPVVNPPYVWYSVSSSGVVHRNELT